MNDFHRPRVEENHPSIKYTGNWRTIAHPSLSGGTMAVANEEGAAGEITFTGTGIAWIGSTCSCGSFAYGYVDGRIRNASYYTGNRLPR